MKKNRRNLDLKPSCQPLNRLRDDYALRNMYYIFVEGNNDQCVFNKITKSSCDVHIAGKKEDIINDFKNKIYSNQYAIVDKDYDEIDNIVKNVFYTDNNDIECTAINIINNSVEMKHRIPIDNSSVSNDFFNENIYIKAIDLSLKISNINKIIREHNKKNHIKYKYIINLYIDRDMRGIMSGPNISNIRKLDEIIDQDFNINYDGIVRKYKSIYNDFSISSVELISDVDNDKSNFRGHDFFTILAYLIDRFKIKVYDTSNNYEKDLCSFLEKKYIIEFSENKEIKMSNLYNFVKETTPNLFD